MWPVSLGFGLVAKQPIDGPQLGDQADGLKNVSLYDGGLSELLPKFQPPNNWKADAGPPGCKDQSATEGFPVCSLTAGRRE